MKDSFKSKQIRFWQAFGGVAAAVICLSLLWQEPDILQNAKPVLKSADWHFIAWLTNTELIATHDEILPDGVKQSRRFARLYKYDILTGHATPMSQLNRFTDNWKIPNLMQYPAMREILSPDKKWIVLGDSSPQTPNSKVTYYRNILALDGSMMHSIVFPNPVHTLRWRQESKGLTAFEYLSVFNRRRQISSKPFQINITLESSGYGAKKTVLNQNSPTMPFLENGTELLSGDLIKIDYTPPSSAMVKGVVVSRSHSNDLQNPFDVQTFKLPTRVDSSELTTIIGNEGILWEAIDTGKSDLPFIGTEITKWRKAITRRATQSFWVSKMGENRFKQLGKNSLFASEVEQKFIHGITWLPYGNNVSFQRGDTLYILPVK